MVSRLLNPSSIYRILFFLLIAVAYIFYRGDNWRLLGPPFAAYSGQDFRQILRASEEMVAGKDIYAHAIPYANNPDFHQFMRWEASPYPYSPIVAVMAIPFLKYPEIAVLIFWTILSWVLLFSTAVVIVRGVVRERAPSVLLTFLLFFAMYAPFHRNLNYIQLDILILFLLSFAYFSYRNNSFFTGIALGLAISLKILVAPMVIYFLWKRDWKTVALSALTAGTLTIIGFSVAGWHQLPDFINVNLLWSTTDMLSFPFNQSVNGVGLRWFTDNPYIVPLINAPILATILRITGIVLAIAIWLKTVSREDNRTTLTGFLEYGFTLSSMLFLSPLVDDVHYVWALLPISGLLMTFKSIKPERITLGLAVVTLLSILYLAHPDLHDAAYYGWESLAYDGTRVNGKYNLLTGAYLYGLVALEICLAANLFWFRRQNISELVSAK